MKLISLLTTIVVCIVLSSILWAQGTPHTMRGYVENPGGGVPDPDCLRFKVFITGDSDTLRYPENYPVTNFSSTSGAWIVQLESLFPEHGDEFVIIFENTCSSFAGYDTAEVDTSVNPQILGTTILGTEAKTKECLPKGVLVLSIVPTPFNDVCNIHLNYKGHVNVIVYNIIGQPVANIYDGYCTGKKTLKWKPDTKPAGLYFIRVITGSESITKRIFFVP